MKDDQDKKAVIAVLGLLIAAVLLCWGFVHVVESKSEVSKQCSNAACPCEDCTCKDCKCGIEPEQGAGAKPPGVPEKTFGNLPPKATKPKLEMFSLPNCPPCEIDKSRLGSWVDAWDVTVYESDFRESGKMYPWYKVTEVDGRQYTFQGPLSTDKVERERRNASSTSR